MTGGTGWFGRPQNTNNGLDPRLKYLLSETCICPCCGASGATLLSLAADGPDPVVGQLEKLPNAALPGTDGNILTEDFCRMDEHRFIRAVIEFSIHDCDAVFTVGCWGSLSAENFDSYLEKFDARETHHLGSAFSWLCNAIPAGMQPPVACEMRFRENAQRPTLHVTDEENPLYAAQQNGLNADTLLSWLKSFGHDPLAGRTLP